MVQKFNSLLTGFPQKSNNLIFTKSKDKLVSLSNDFNINLPLHKRVILQIIPSLHQGGAEKGTLEIAQAITKAGGKALVASSGGSMVPELESLGGTHITLPLDAKNPVTLILNICRLKKMIRDHRVDLIHARSRAPAWSAFWAARLTNTPFVTTFHGTYNFDNPLKKYYNSIMVRGMRVIAISHFIYQHILEHYSSYVDPAHVFTISRGVDLRVFNWTEADLATRAQNLQKAWQIDDAFPLLLLPGRLTRWKGQRIALEAMSLLKDQKNFKGLLILLGSDQGRTEYKQELLQLSQNLGIAEHVRFISHCSDMPAAYTLADLVLHTSTDPEAFGRIIAEAQAMGRCVIATDHGAPPEIIEEGQTGFLTKPGNPWKLAEKINAFLMLTPLQRKHMEEKAIERVHRFFSRDQMEQKTLQVYAELVTVGQKQAL
jgi:glycosyltransferase involved in cell wall biosynthesis